MKGKTNKIFGGFVRLLDENAPTISMIGSLAGIVLMGYTAYKAAKQSAKIQDEYEFEKASIEADNEIQEEEKKREITNLKIQEGIKHVYTYRWSILSGLGAGSLSFLSNYLNGRKIAGLAAALALSEDKLKKLGAKAKEFLSSEEYQKIINGQREELIRENTAEGDDLPWDVDEETAKHIFYDTYLGACLEVPESQVLDAITNASRMTFIKGDEWWGMLGMPSCPGRRAVGWGPKNRFNAHIGSMMLHGKYIKTIEYDREPVGLSERKSKRQGPQE